MRGSWRFLIPALQSLRGPAVFFCCLVAFLLPRGAADSLPDSGLPAESLPLAAGKSIERELFEGQTHSYTFELSRGKFLRIDFYSSSLDLLVSMEPPGNGGSLEWAIPKRISAPIAFIAGVRGIYRLRIQNSGAANGSGAYRLDIRAVRAAEAPDKKRAAACRRISNAAQLRRQWTEASLRKAVGEYDKARLAWREVDDQSQEAAALRQAGDVWEILSEWQTALTCYKEAQALYRRLGDRAGQDGTANKISILSIDRGEFQKALELYGPEPPAYPDPWERAQALHNFGAAYYGINEMQKATAYLEKSLVLRKRLQDREGQADSLMCLGYVHHATKDISAAEQYYRQSLALWKSAQNPRGTALALAALGHLSNISGERQRALDYYDQSQQIFQTIGDLSGRYTVLEGKAYLYAGLGDKEKALQHYRTALGLVRRTRDLSAEGAILDYISGIYRDLGDYERALQHSRESVRINRSMPSILGESYALSNMGKAQEALGKPGDAAESYARALELSRKGGDRFLEGLLVSALGHLHHEAGRLREALEYYRQALSLQNESGDSVRMPGTLYDLARAERDAGNLDPAIQYARRGLDITESLRGKVASPELRGAYLASVHQQHELLIDLLMQRHEEGPPEHSDALALQASERARARSLLDSLLEANADIRQGADPVLLERERSLQKSLNEKANRQMQLLGRKHSREDETALAKEIGAISEEYEEVQSQIRAKSPHYAALTQPQPLGLAEIQRLVVDEETMLLEYALGERRSYLWAVTPASFQSFELPGRAEIESRANRVRELMLARQNKAGETAAQYQQRIKKADEAFVREAAGLSRTLLGPISDQLKSQRLLVVVEGALQYLPFAALPKPKSDAPLMADHEIVSLPSASVLAVLREEIRQRPSPPKIVAVLADPVFEPDDPRIERKRSSLLSRAASPPAHRHLPASQLHRAAGDPGPSDETSAVSRLPASRDEADSIMSMVPEGAGRKIFGFDANRTVALESGLGQFRIVHFATHAFLNDEHPELSALVLSLFDEQGRPQDGYLRLHDIYNLRLPVELVVLSACNSGLGKEIRGEGLVGIVRGFMYAGAARIVASLWKVEDEATAELMKRFYQHMLQDGQPPAQALRTAQLDLRRQKRWQSPYYWAAFVLQGEWK